MQGFTAWFTVLSRVRMMELPELLVPGCFYCAVCVWEAVAAPTPSPVVQGGPADVLHWENHHQSAAD